MPNLQPFMGRKLDCIKSKQVERQELMVRNYQHPTFSLHAAKPTAYGREAGYEMTNIVYEITSSSLKQ